MGWTERGDALRFAQATPIEPGGAERLDMSLSGPQSVGAFSSFVTLDDTPAFPRVDGHTTDRVSSI